MPLLPAETKQGQVPNTRWTKRTLLPLWVNGGRTNQAGFTFSKNMTSYSTEVRLRCRGASQETERLLSSLCVKINWDTVTGAAGERRENVRKKHKQCKQSPSPPEALSFLLVPRHATGAGSHCHCRSLTFLFCCEREPMASVAINCFPSIVRFYLNSGSMTSDFQTKSVFQETTCNPAPH